MPDTYKIGPHFESFIQGQLASGRYGDAGEVVRDALRLLEDRERHLIALDVAVARGVADVEAGRTYDADAVFDEAEARYAATAQGAGGA